MSMISPRPIERYQEKAIQEACVAWLTATRGYREIFGDKEAVGARFDSVGEIEGRLLLIEFKIHVSERMVRHENDRPGTLESKVVGALAGLYSGRADSFSKAGNSVWDRRSPPIVAIVAKSYLTGALSDLIEMLGARSQELRFDFGIWRWADNGLDVIASGSCLEFPSDDWLTEIEVPHLVGRNNRAKNLNLIEMREEAVRVGVAELFDAFAAEARRCRMRIEVGRRSIRAGYPPSKGGTVFACGKHGDRFTVSRLHRRIRLGKSRRPAIRRHHTQSPAAPPPSSISVFRTWGFRKMPRQFHRVVEHAKDQQFVRRGEAVDDHMSR